MPSKFINSVERLELALRTKDQPVIDTELQFLLTQKTFLILLRDLCCDIIRKDRYNKNKLF